MKKLLVVLSLLSCVGGAWGMEGERKKPTVYYAGLAVELIEIPAQVIELSRIMRDIVRKQELMNAKRFEVGDKIRVVLPLDAWLGAIKNSDHALRLFIECSAGKKDVQILSQEDLFDVILVADALVATKSEEENFTPRKDMLEVLLQELAVRIKKMLNDKEWVRDFLNGKGLLREVLQKLPPSVQDELIRRSVGLSELFMVPVVLYGHTGLVRSLLELGDGRLASGSWDKTIIIWKKGPDGKFTQEQVLRGHEDSVSSLLELGDGRLASGSGDETIIIWKKGPDGKFTQEQVLRGHKEEVYFLLELRDGRLASGSRDKTIRIWDITPKIFAQSVVVSMFASGPELFELKQSFSAKMKTYFVKTNPVVQQTTQEEEWYKKLFADEFVLNTFASLPEASLHQIIELKGSKVVRIALEMLLDGIREDMEEEEYIEQHKTELAKRFEVVLRLLKSLNLSEKDWALDPLVGYYKDAQSYAVRMPALREEAKKHEKNEKLEKKSLKEEEIEIKEEESEKK